MMTGIQTGVPFVDWILAALDSLGYLIVFGFTVFENLFLIGSPMPGETIVVGGALVASRGGLVLYGVWLASFFGTVIGSNITYWGGRRAGIDAIASFVSRISKTRFGRIFGVTEEMVLDLHEHFHTEGSKTVLISRFAIGAKNIVPAIAGATGMPIFWFELYTMVGAIIYTSLMCAIGWFLGENLELALDVVQGVGFAGLGIFVIFLIAIWQLRSRIKQRRGMRQLEEDAEEAAQAVADAAAEVAERVVDPDGEQSADRERPADPDPEQPVDAEDERSS